MIDPATVISLVTKLISAYSDYSSREDDIQRIIRELDGFRSVLVQIQNIAKDGHLEGAAKSAYEDLIKPGGVLTECEAEFIKLGDTLKPAKVLKSIWLATTWPLKKKGIADILTALDRNKATLNTSLNVINTAINANKLAVERSMRQGVAVLAKNSDNVIAEELRSKILQWLAAPAPSSDYQAALDKRCAGTGTWLVGSDKYKEWKYGLRSFLWINGIPGCGKSVLCSPVIEDMLQESKNTQVGLAFYFFTFSDTSKQRVENLLKSLLSQFFRLSAVSDGLQALYEKYNHGFQGHILNDLLEALYEMLAGYQHAYIVIDALDECIEPKELLDLLGKIAKWGLGNLHIFATSRKEPDLENGLKPLVSAQIDIQNSIVDMDIKNFVHQRLQSDRKFKKWGQEIQDQITKTLLEGSKGMFQWVVCQLDELQDCHSLSALEKALTSLPKTLDETYQRILLKISKDHQKDVFYILQWLTFSKRPMEPKEIAEALAVDFDSGYPQFDAKRKWQDPDEIIFICANFVTTDTMYTYKGDVTVLKLAHFSVKEYLVSDYIKDSLAKQYWLNKQSADIIIAQSCLAYLFQFNTPDALSQDKINDFPLALYAGHNWMHHAQSDNTDSCIILQQMIIKLFQFSSVHYTHWTTIEQGSEFTGDLSNSDMITPIYYTSAYSFQVVLQEFINKGADINAPGGRYGNALHVASYMGNKRIVQLLLDKGADIHAQGGYYGNALQAASERGNERIVQLLLDKGADIHAQGGHYGNALQAASARGNEMIVQLLLDRGADIHAQKVWHGNILQAALESGNERIVQLLLDRGADIHVQGNFHGNALQAASERGNERIVQLLLDGGADIHAQGGHYGNALQAASASGNEIIVQLLLDRGANIHTQGGHYESALQAASARGNKRIVQLLLDKGANIHAQGDYYGNALQAASASGNERIVQLLLDKGADIYAQGGWYGNALQAALVLGNERIVQLLHIGRIID